MDNMMKQNTLVERFNLLEIEYENILKTKSSKYNSALDTNGVHVDTAQFTIWVGRVKKLLEDSYGKDSDFYFDFIKAQKGFYATNHQILTKQLKPVFDAAKADLPYATSFNSKSIIKETHSIELILNILRKFPAFCHQLKKRYNNRSTIEVMDEYDVQDLVHSLLILHFDDVRAEDASPSNAGSNSRVDFLLNDEKIIIEVKKTRQSLGTAKLGEELLVDMSRYRAHPDYETLICFVYDPDRRVQNPIGLIKDLERHDPDGKTRVVIAQH